MSLLHYISKNVFSRIFQKNRKNVLINFQRFKTPSTKIIALFLIIGCVFFDFPHFITFAPHTHKVLAATDTIRPTDAYNPGGWSSVTSAFDSNTTTSASVTNINNTPSISFGGSSASEGTASWTSKTGTWTSATLYVTFEKTAGSDDTVELLVTDQTGALKTTLVAATSGAVTKQEFSAVLSSSDWGGSGFPNISNLRVRVNGTKGGKADGMTTRVYEVRIDAQALSLDSDATVTSSAALTEPSTLSSIADTDAEKVGVFDFTITDGGSADGQPLTVSQIIMHTGGTGNFNDITWKLNGPDASYVLGTISSGTLTFSNLNISVSNGGTETYTVYGYFSSSPTSTDGQTFTLSTDGDTDFTVGSSGTQMSATTAVTNGSGFSMDVAHTQLVFTSEPPSAANTSTDFTGTVTIAAVDANNNIDTDFAENITLSAVLASNHATAGSGTLSSIDIGGLTKTSTNGVASWTDLKYSTAEIIDLKAISSTYSSGIFSSDITVSELPAVSLVQEKSAAHTYTFPSTSITVTLNSAATAGNLLISGIAIDKASGAITVPTGFTLIQKNEAGITSGAFAYKIATGGETSITWNYVNLEEASVWIGEYQGLITSNVLDQTTENDAYVNTAVNSISTGVTGATTQASELAVAFFTSDSGNSVGSTRSWSNGFSTVAEVTETSGSPFLNIATKLLQTTGTVETTLTDNGSDESYAAIATFKVNSGPAPISISSAADQIFTVSDSATPISTITVTDNEGTSSITAANDIRIRIPSTFNMTWDSTDTTATIGGDASAKVSSTVSYEENNKVLVLNVTSDFAAADSISVSDLSFTNFSASSTPSHLTLEIDNAGTTADTDDKSITIKNISKSFQNDIQPDANYTGTSDTYIEEFSPTTNYGTSTIVHMDGDNPSGSTKDNVGLLKWDVSTIPTGSIVTGASITVYVNNSSADSYEIYEIKKNWTEDGATWNTYDGVHAWETAGAQGTTDRGSTELGSFPSSSVGSLTVDLNSSGIALVQQWIDDPSTNFGLLFGDSISADGLYIDSSESLTTSQRPKLTITYENGTIYSISITSSGVIEYGYVPLNTATTTANNGFTQMIQNNGDTAKINVKSSNATGGITWTLGTTPGQDIFKHEVSTTSGSTYMTFPASDTYITASSSVASGDTVNFDFRLTPPVISTDFLEKAITITIQAVTP